MTLHLFVCMCVHAHVYCSRRNHKGSFDFSSCISLSVWMWRDVCHRHSQSQVQTLTGVYQMHEFKEGFGLRKEWQERGRKVLGSIASFQV